MQQRRAISGARGGTPTPASRARRRNPPRIPRIQHVSQEIPAKDEGNRGHPKQGTRAATDHRPTVTPKEDAK